ncbi:signal transduction histidine kinase [Azospirillum agricola]|uniref:sensor histidine kinase n=1 Tax=Azospirillum agricola TaxID=1720247 RepID=UPI001AE915C5|nr:ATP-binding protein [Azospirillum agricola]MBP2228881.1 signal transduction histidine kinase [Azospirillum agricola]
MVRLWGSPVAMMVAATLFALLCAASATGLAILQPSLGLSLHAGDDGGVILDPAPGRGSAAVAAAFGREPPAPLRLLAIGPAPADGGAGAGPLHPLTADDLIPEPDALPTYAVLADFFGRQSVYAALLRRGPVVLLLRDGTGAERQVVMTPEEQRDPGDLPAVFWFQAAVGVIGLLMSCWVWALRPNDRGARLFALVGLSMLGFTLPAAVYSTRELALDGSLFRVLSDLNAAGAMTFGAAMIGVFLSYPRRIAGPAGVALPFAVFGAWLLAHLLRLPEGHGDGAHLPTLLEMLCIVGAIGAQWWATRRDPVGRAALSWLGLSVTVGAGAFVTLMSVPLLTGLTAPIPQGYAFGFFLLIHAGLTLGLRRYRLFELGDWAFRVMLAALGLVALLLLDMALVATLQFDQNLALGLSLLAVGFLYLPLRDLLMRRLVGRRTIPDDELFDAVMEVAFTATAEQRAAAWTGLLRRLFDPLEMEPSGAPPSRPSVGQDGLMLELPPTAGAPGLRLRYPWGGRGLFTPAQLSTATRLCELMARAESGREAYVRGAAAERQRIARDLHDDLGARLLSAMHQSDLDRSHGMVREAMADVRTIVRGLSGERQPLGQVLGDLRHETAQRLEGTGIALHWPVAAEADPAEDIPVDYALCRTLTATLREAVSNAIRHAGATSLAVSVGVAGGTLAVAVADDGTGFDPARAAGSGRGFGLGNMAARAAELGGRLDIAATGKGTRMELSLPLPQTVAAEGTGGVP